jgi:RNA polymerase sigma-70 factor (ECF subfamily)
MWKMNPRNAQEPRMISESDGYLVRRIGSGDQEAFRTLYRRCQGPVFRFVLHMSGSHTAAEDVTQDVFLTLIRDSDRFDPSRGNLLGYLLGIGRNLLLRRLEKERVFVTFPGARDAGESDLHKQPEHASLVVPAVDPVRNETIGRVRQAVLSLPTNYREVVVLCDLQELSYEEAAGVLHVAVGTVRSRLHRGRTLLTAKLREFRKTGLPVAAVSKTRSGS